MCLRVPSSLVFGVVLLSGWLVGCGTPAPASNQAPQPPADTTGGVLAAYRQAAGGAALDAITSLRATGISIDPALGGNRRLVIEVAKPTRYRHRESPLEGTAGPRVRTLVGYDGTLGWRSGNTILAGDGLSPDLDVRQAAITAAARQNYLNTLAGMLPLWLLDNGITLTPIGPMQDGEDRGALVFTLHDADTLIGRLLLDADTHLPRRLVVAYQRHIRPDGGEYAITFHDYKPVSGGALLPHRVTREQAAATTTSPPTSVQWVIRTYEINPALAEEIFAPPAR
jgi:hypothetical protein